MLCKRIFIRFGELPQNGKSLNHLTKKYEDGISVYEAIIDRQGVRVILPSLTGSACVSLSGCLDKPSYQVTGRIVGRGSDGEPLLTACKTIGKLNLNSDSQGWG